MQIILWAIPFFAILIITEIIVDHIRKTKFYRINDSIVSLYAGILSRVNGIFRQIIPFVIYIWVEANFSLFDFSDSLILWVAVFIGYDFLYYWKHRMGHEVNILWASHVVHHSSEEYNLTTALRQTSGSILDWIFYLPLAFIGVEPSLLFSVAALNLVYQFWVHTRHIPKLGWYEWAFVTPSNHRVHHAVNQNYVDKNYGGVFILWDRLFGTFQEEDESDPCLYGIRKPIKSWNPIWVNFHFYAQLIKDTWRTKAWKDKIKIWFMPTGWRPKDVEAKYPLAVFNAGTFEKFEIPISIASRVYALVQLVVILVVVFIYMQFISRITVESQFMWGAFIIFSGYSTSQILEARTWGVASEIVRHISFSYLIWLEFNWSPVFIFAMLLSVFSSLSVMLLTNQPSKNIKTAT